jgi:FHS family L-fucose permease-like MFS transporter
MIMAIIGGALITPAQGALLDAFGVSLSYLLPLACYAVILVFAIAAQRRA